MHQANPTKPGESRNPVTMMASKPAYAGHAVQSNSLQFSEQIEKLIEVFPKIPQAKLAALINEENGILEAVVTRVVSGDIENDVDESVLECVQKQENQPPYLCSMANIPIETSKLKDILVNVNKMEEKQETAAVSLPRGQVLSFHRPTRSTVPTHEIGTGKPDACSLALSRASVELSYQVCNSCLKSAQSRLGVIVYNFYLSDGWTRYQSSAYKFVNETLTNSKARQRCHNMSAGADLVSISNEGDEQFVANLVKGLPGIFGVWLGLNDHPKEGTFVWFDGTNSNYRNWHKGEPNDSDKYEDCVEKNTRVWMAVE
ncbi:hypothetical protein QZH41_013881 [Actinostola sp. cb2023]|nr:hypothetical protein QZH41_013881 [Actinostola sp. cb2023]